MQTTKNKHAIVRGVSVSRSNLIELIILVILAALGVNLIAGYLLTFLTLNSLMTIVAGAILCVGSVLYLAARLLGRRVESRTYDAFLIYNNKTNEIIRVPRYEFSERVYEYMEGAFAENPALKTLWKKEPLKDLSVSDQVKGKRHRSAQLLSEATEYFVLDRLSTHLIDYFADENFKEENLKRYGREDIPEVLLSNRFLELFSRPMEERAAFVHNTFGEERVGEVVSSYGAGGAIYGKFELILPKKSAARRPQANKVEIEMKKLMMSITVRFEGFCTVLPEGFEQYYLGISRWPDFVTEYKVNVDIQVTMKLGALFSGMGWEYYRWVDSFLDEIEGNISEDAFFKRLDWESAFTVLQCLKRAQRKKTKNKEPNISNSNV